MKTIITISLIFFGMFTTQAQLAPLSLADNPDEWSKPQSFTLTAANGTKQNVEITAKLVKHKGTTGFIDVKIINYGPKDIVRMYVSLINGPVDAKTFKGVNYNNSGLYSIKNGFNTTLKLQLRECHPKGSSGMSDLEKCKACQPWIAIADIAFK